MNSHTPAAGYIPTPDDIDRIAALPNPVIRNLQITQCYHELAVALTVRTGVAANWCIFATWASKQAGQTIRKEDLARLLETIRRTTPSAMQALPTAIASLQASGTGRNQAALQASVVEVLNPLRVIDRASDAVGRGNRKVFEEIGREFARFFAVCLHDPVYDSGRLARFIEGLRPGEPPDGQRYLRQAFARYYQALFESNAKTRAELMLLANIEIGFHEQTRLQPEITEAMDAAFVSRRQMGFRLIRALSPYQGWLERARLFVVWLLGQPGPLDAILDLLLAEARRQAHLIITEYMLAIGLPHGVRLRLGDDIPAEFPASLKQIVLPDLCALLAQLDPTPDSTRDSGTADWSHLPDRLHFIIDLFRCYHEAADLFDPPFTEEQVTALKAGRLPAGRL